MQRDREGQADPPSSSVNRELGAMTAVITHNAAIAAMADRVLQLADGRLVVDRRNPARAAPETLVW